MTTGEGKLPASGESEAKLVTVRSHGPINGILEDLTKRHTMSISNNHRTIWAVP
jgi:hypothetical protein